MAGALVRIWPPQPDRRCRTDGAGAVRGGDTGAGPDGAVPRQLADPRVQIAMRTPQGEAIADWARFLAAEIDPSPQGTVVVLRDLRYTRPPYRGWAVVSIPLPAIHSD